MTVEKFFQQFPDAPGVWQAGEKLYLRSAKAAAEAQAGKAGLELKWVLKPMPESKPKQKQVSDGTE